jgi:fumarate hydratase subunit beta
LCRRYGRAYLLAPSGAAASLSKRIKSLRVIAYEDLGTEAVYEIEVEDFPLIVATDKNGLDIFSLE